jgi:plasmid stabilization system protein ParE
LREVVYGNYRIVYRVTLDLIEVLAVVHASRDFPPRSAHENE